MLAVIFIHDWQATTTGPVIVKATPDASAEATPPTTSAVIPEASKPEPTPAKPAPAKPSPEKAEPEVAPDPLPEPKTADDDPWTAEKQRLGDKGRRGGVIRVNPRIIVNGEAFAFGGAPAFGGPGVFAAPRIVVPEIRGFAVPPAHIDPERFAEDFLADAKGRHAAMTARGLILAQIPEARPFIDGFAAGKDGRLVVKVRDAFMEFDDARRKTVMEGIAQVWRDSNMPRLLRVSDAVEFRGPDDWKETITQ